ncbi:glycoside hydrolase family 3 N-terminal domain-containing protein [Streptomyces sp. VRA16 Mangrove soil]|uniref:glycoside hydrolase family 3 N-terminal domain-containing protein n=1 Tax=Streptomyces sp. VRA16 Mangrove soil TaxID=2817434 RepID=UPI001A9E8940|nr:glycoside hydrolase family 3 N-terminal domain-containing protein [Streptomyces sp. VRA16 Mangrove soil]MBO1329828.1 glycoside hydrolase family 3 C-terminal domain-containing protein [Streptomyces sp. VRA16 Mangrove soil]
MTTAESLPSTGQVVPRWQDPSLPVSERVDALLAEMTVAEKVAQLGSRWLGNFMGSEAGDDEGGGEAERPQVAPLEAVFKEAGRIPLEEAARDGLGHLTRVYGSRPVNAEEGTALLVAQQHTVVKGSRLGIPALAHEECLTGFNTYGATVYPAPLAWAAAFDPDLVRRLGRAIGRDLRASGVHQGLAPVLDVVRDYRWGRVEETMGEDPYLVSTLGAAYVGGVEGAGVIATLKHFAGYSAARGARNHGPVPMGRRELMDVILPPFETAIAVGGARSVMNSYSDIDGVPAGADPWLLTQLLRDDWGFTGTVVSDYGSLAFLAGLHGVAADFDEAGVMALEAGIDVELPDTLTFGRHLEDRVRRGELPESLLDRAVRRLLTQKVELGLLDPGWTPEGSLAPAAARDLNSPENRKLARELAERSVILLDAGSALPLVDPDAGRTAPARVAVVGPCAADARTLMGCYAFPNHVLPRHPGLPLGISAPTVVEALRAEFPDAEIVFEPGCDVREEDRSGFAAAAAAARGAELCIAVVGDRAGLFGNGTSGEGCDVEDLRLPGVQAELLAQLFATGTPVVVVVLSGRPYALGEVHPRSAGLVQAFMPGQEGAAAIAGVLSGRVQPAGRLPVQIPRRPGGQPGTYLQPPLGAHTQGISSVDPTPLFPFGHGGSYTTFEIDDLHVSAHDVPTDGEFTVSVRVRNTGARPGREVVQLYLRDPVAQVSRPVRQLTGFAQVDLAPGASARVAFRVHADRTAFTGRALARIVEPGEVEVQVGDSSQNLPCRAAVRLTGPTREVGHDRRLTTPVDVTLEEADATAS